MLFGCCTRKQWSEKRKARSSIGKSIVCFGEANLSCRLDTLPRVAAPHLAFAHDQKQRNGYWPSFFAAPFGCNKICPFWDAGTIDGCAPARDCANSGLLFAQRSSRSIHLLSLIQLLETPSLLPSGRLSATTQAIDDQRRKSSTSDPTTDGQRSR